jgi:hypothetical protein
MAERILADRDRVTFREGREAGLRVALDKIRAIRKYTEISESEDELLGRLASELCEGLDDRF